MQSRRFKIKRYYFHSRTAEVKPSHVILGIAIFIGVVIVWGMILFPNFFAGIFQKQQLEPQETEIPEEQVVPQVQEKKLVFDEEYCLSLLRNHIDFKELTFTRRNISSRIIQDSIFSDGETKRLITIEYEGKKLLKCELLINKKTDIDFTGAKKYKCDNEIEAFSIEEQTDDYIHSAFRSDIKGAIADHVFYGTPSFEADTYKINMIKRNNCKEV